MSDLLREVGAMLGRTMIKIVPTIEWLPPTTAFRSPVSPVSVVIPGSRVLVRMIDANNSAMLIDLPVCTAMLSPTILNESSGDAISVEGHTGWYTDQLRYAYAHRVTRKVTVSVEVRKKFRKIILLNTIDDLYGHSLLKLLNASRHLRDHSEYGLCVLVQPHLRKLVPKEVAEVWEVDIPAREGVLWFDSLAEWIKNRLALYDEVHVSRAYGHLPPRFYRLADFIEQAEPPDWLTNRRPVIAIQSRSDRLWGTSVRHQERRFRRLYHELRWRFPNLALVFLGFTRQPALPKWDGLIDLRTDSLTDDREALWFRVMTHTDCAIGVHGSNMLLPSGLADCTIELLPEFKYPVAGTTFLFQEDHVDPRMPLLTHTQLFGDDSLSEISPERLARVIAFKLTYGRSHRKFFALAPGNNDRGDMDTILADTAILSSFHTTKRRGLLGRLKETLRRSLVCCASRLE